MAKESAEIIEALSLHFEIKPLNLRDKEREVFRKSYQYFYGRPLIDHEILDHDHGVYVSMKILPAYVLGSYKKLFSVPA